VSNTPHTQIDRWSSKKATQGKSSWLLFAFVIALIFHLGLFWYLKKIEFFSNKVPLPDVDEVYVINTDHPDFIEVIPENHQTIPDYSQENDIIEDIDVALAEIKNQDLDMRTDIDAPDITVSISLPSKAGDIDGSIDNLILNTHSELVLEDLGTALSDDTLADEGQIILKTGAMQGELLDQTDLIDNKTLLGSGGVSEDGLLKGYNSLDSLLSMSSIELDGSKTALPSDLLFEYDSAKLKRDARFGLIKLGMLIERNPKMYCLLEGHTDLFGPESYNNQLSLQRAQSVKSYLVKSLRISGKNILTKGHGKSQPLISQGDQNQQSPNRRVDILMRQELPKSYTTRAEPIKPHSTTDNTPPQPQPAIIIEPEETPPSRAIVIEEAPLAQPKREPIKVTPVGRPTERYLEILENRRKNLPQTPRRAIIID